MKGILCIIVFCSISVMSFAHDYFFSFAEVNYNASTKNFEISIEASAHDVEDAMNEVGIEIKELEDHYSDSLMMSKIQAFISSGFSLTIDGKQLDLSLIGYEVKNTGMVYFYFKSNSVDKVNQVKIKYDWLMDQMPQQQNKISLSVYDFKSTSVFIASKRSELITIK